jgi:hypothetical protein
MSKKDLLKEELNRIQRMMGINEALLMEQPIPMPKSLIKNILKSSDDVAEPLLRIFNLTDNQIDDVIRQIDRVGVDNLSDDVLEALARNSIDNVDELARLLKVGKYLGSNFDEIAIKIFDRVDSMAQISPEVRKKVVDIYKKKLDEIPFLENSDEIKQKLVRDFQTEFDTKFSDRMVREAGESVDRILDEVLGTDPLSDIPSGAISDNVRNLVSRNTEAYKNFIKSARKKGSFLQDITKEEYDKIMQDVLSSTKRVDRDVLDELKVIMKKEPNWWTKMSLAKKVGFVISAIGLGPTVGAVLWYSTLTRFKNWGDIVWIKKFFSGATGTTIELNNSNVENWFKSTYPAKYVDKNNFENNFTITLNNTKTRAVIMSNDGTEEWEVLLSDNEIQEIN